MSKNIFLKWILFTIVTISILFPIYKHGFVFSLDSVFAPNIRYPGYIGFDTIYQYIIFLINHILPAWIIEKIILSLIIFLSLNGIFLLIRKRNFWIKISVSLIYIFNPFFYYRFVSGEYRLLLSYSLIFYIFFYIDEIYKNFSILDKKTILHKCIMLIFFVTICIGIYPRSFSIIGIFYAIYVIVHIAKNRIKRTNFILIWPFVFMMAMVIYYMIFEDHIYTILPASIQASIDISRDHLVAFSYDKSLQNIIFLTGSWIEWGRRYLNPIVSTPIAFFMSIYALCAIYMAIIKKDKNVLDQSIFWFLIVALFILFSGESQAYWWMTKNNLLILSLRDNSKMLYAVLVFEIYYLAIFLDENIKKIKNKNFKMLFEVLVICLPLISMPIIYYGLSGQIVSRDYPSKWYKMNNYLNNYQDDSRVLFLPWHQYMTFSFTKNVIQNPAPYFFDKKMVVADNLEFSNLYSQSKNTETKKIEQIFSDKSDIAKALSAMNIRFILLCKSVDWTNYLFIESQKNIIKKYEDEEFILYEIIYK